MSALLFGVLHVAVALAFAPLLLGIIVKIKAIAAGRVGPPLVQPYWDLLRLWRKGSVFSTTTTWVFKAGPVVSLVAVTLALLLMPQGARAAPLGFEGDVVLFAYLLGLARFFTIVAALDTGSAFEGMGAAREATFSALAEPALFLGLMVLVRQAGAASLTSMLEPATMAHAWGASRGALLLVAVSFFVVLLVENSRVPVDDPATHLELTMIHEVMVLDHSGPGFGAILLGASLKLFVLGSLVLGVVAPFSLGNVALDLGLFLLGQVALAVGVGVLESSMARLKLLHVPRLLVTASILAVFGILLGG
jgi:formate hydrogenlyase subunit 4